MDRRFTAESMRGNPFADFDETFAVPSDAPPKSLRRRSSHSTSETANPPPPFPRTMSTSETMGASIKTEEGWALFDNPLNDSSGDRSRVGSFAPRDAALDNFLAISAIVRGEPSSMEDGTERELVYEDVYEEEEDEQQASLDERVHTTVLQDAFQSYDRWLRSDITRAGVETLLAAEASGAFVVRPSSREGHTVLCLKFDRLILHYLIEKFVFSIR
jgi:hypothetical protein